MTLCPYGDDGVQGRTAQAQLVQELGGSAQRPPGGGVLGSLLGRGRLVGLLGRAQCHQLGRATRAQRHDNLVIIICVSGVVCGVRVRWVLGRIGR